MRWSLTIIVLLASIAIVLSVPVPGVTTRSATRRQLRPRPNTPAPKPSHQKRTRAAKKSIKHTIALGRHANVVQSRNAKEVQRQELGLTKEQHRDWTAKFSSNMYRKNAEVSTMVLDHGKTLRPRRPTDHTPGTHLDADHVFEHQMLKKGLEKAGINWNTLTPHQTNGIREILNHPDNMMFTSASVNRSKGSRIRTTLQNRTSKSPFPAATQEYVLASAPVAAHTANKLDDFLKAEKLGSNPEGTHMHDILHETYRRQGHIGPTETINTDIFKTLPKKD